MYVDNWEEQGMIGHRIEVESPSAEPKDGGWLQFSTVRQTTVVQAVIVNFGGHGIGRFAFAMLRDGGQVKVRVPGGYWFVSGDVYARLNLGLKIGRDSEYMPAVGTLIELELGEDPNTIVEVWGLKESMRVVRDASRPRSVGDAMDRVRSSADTVDLTAIEDRFVSMLDDGDFPEGGIERLRASGLLTVRVQAKLDELGIVIEGLG